MEIQERILNYLSVYEKENKYRIASALKLDEMEITKALEELEEKGEIEMKGGRAFLIKGRKTITTKAKKQKQLRVEVKEEQPETQKEEVQPEETPAKEEEESHEKSIRKEKIEGTVKFYNLNKGFGFIIGDDGKEYYIHKSGLKDGVTIEANDRVSFKPVEGDRGPKAEEVGWISQA